MLKTAAGTLAVLGIFINIWLYLERTRHTSDDDGEVGSVWDILKELQENITKLTAKHSRLQVEMGHLSARLSISSCSVKAKEFDSFRRLQRYEYYDKHTKDFALESAGARILDTGSTQEHVFYQSFISRVLYAMTSFLCRGCHGARTMLQPGSMPGECWAFKGSRGEAVIRLLGSVNVTGVAFEHIPTEIAPAGDISSAPRHIQLEGVDDPSSRRGHDFGKFEYDREGRTIQYFEVVRPADRYFSMVRVRFLNNWGHPVYTCVYRVRVHGELAPGQAYTAREKVGDAD